MPNVKWTMNLNNSLNNFNNGEADTSISIKHERDSTSYLCTSTICALLNFVYVLTVASLQIKYGLEILV